jgi:predicted GIY-YIG superfamily endonuclease
MDEKWFCYILKSKNEDFKNFTYNGSTNNLVRRLRQHNGEIVGGAKATKGKGEFEYYFIMTGFKNHKNTLSCEWRIKHPTNQRQRPKKYCGIDGRILGLNEFIHCEKWTSKCSDNNIDCNYTIYLQKDVSKYLSSVPDNIKIVIVDTIDLILINDIMKKIEV